MKKTVKFEKIRDYDDSVKGYRLGKYYLLKFYTWGNTYSWCVTDTADIPATDLNMLKFEKEHFVKWVFSCKEGKEMLCALNA